VSIELQAASFKLQAASGKRQAANTLGAEMTIIPKPTPWLTLRLELAA
jgi:hypothetical protein